MFRNESANTDLIIGVCSSVCLTLGFSRHEYMIAVCGVGCFAVVVYRAIRRCQGKKIVEAVPPVTRVRRRNIAAAKRHPKTTQEYVDQMIGQGRYALLLRPTIAKKLSQEQLAQVAELIREEMAAVEPGTVRMRAASEEDLQDDRCENVAEPVPGIYIDRYAVTNAEYQTFIDAGGYEKDELWDEAASDLRGQFTDTTCLAAPRFFENGTFAEGTERLPVVGISWFEACAFARWAGKRLPTDPEWTKAASSPKGKSMAIATQPQYPWGNSIDEARANLWWTGRRAPVDVTEHSDGDTVTGACQMIGNIWEWTQDEFGRWSGRDGWVDTSNLRSVRGGAFDTYLESQAACTGGSGDEVGARRHNIGFRCVLDRSHVDVIPPSPDSELATA